MQIHFPVCLAVCSANHRELRFRENPLSVVILFFLAAPSMPVAFQSVEIFPADGIGKGIFIFQESFVSGSLIVLEIIYFDLLAIVSLKSWLTFVKLIVL